jgi:hypothetical protein
MSSKSNAETPLVRVRNSYLALKNRPEPRYALAVRGYVGIGCFILGVYMVSSVWVWWGDDVLPYIHIAGSAMLFGLAVIAFKRLEARDFALEYSYTMVPGIAAIVIAYSPNDGPRVALSAAMLTAALQLLQVLLSKEGTIWSNKGDGS